MITYITINMSEIALVDFNQVLETSEQTVRLSVDGLQTVLKWEGAEPSFVSTLSSYEGTYTHDVEPMDPGVKTYYPGERTKQTRARNLKQGIPVSEEVWNKVLELLE